MGYSMLMAAEKSAESVLEQQTPDGNFPVNNQLVSGEIPGNYITSKFSTFAGAGFRHSTSNMPF
ncbi:MAG: hypothetical protein HC906_07580 [Bacteroidales bacterium]|nr:hypothetical protein [Bacteroidales bacterium]